MKRPRPSRARRPEEDARHLRRCLELASRAEGMSRPNPMVGALVVKGGRILAEAFHALAGAEHAERIALRRAGRRARGATLYSNLEPCCHWGRTPPCVDAILQSGVGRVVVSHRDPDPRVNGKGIGALRRAGVTVSLGGLRQPALDLNERHVIFHTQKRPHVLVKAAMSLDGRIATPRGASRWVSSRESRERAHRLRAASDAILIGAGTLRADDPLLTARRMGRALPRARQPLRVVLGGGGALDPGSRILHTPGGPVIVYVTRAARARHARLERAGAEVVAVRASARTPGRVSITACLLDLARRGITAVMVEGGGEVIASALEEGVVDRVVLFVAPRILGGRRAVPAVGGRGAETVAGGIALTRLVVSSSGPDLVIEGAVAHGRR